MLYICTAVVILYICTAVVMLYICTAVVMLYICTTVVMLYICTNVVMLYICTAVVMLYICTPPKAAACRYSNLKLSQRQNSINFSGQRALSDELLPEKSWLISILHFSYRTGYCSGNSLHCPRDEWCESPPEDPTPWLTVLRCFFVFPGKHRDKSSWYPVATFSAI
jgi:hypothetical protein